MDLGRLVNEKRKIDNPKPENAGSLLIFCEGSTEYNYLDYFKTYLEHNLKAHYSNIVLEPINAEGNAMHVYNYAEEFLADDTNRTKYDLYEKHLVFDCDAPENIEEVLRKMSLSDNDYIIDYSNLLFETWLAMHFMILTPEMNNGKSKMYEAMRIFLGVDNYGSVEKADVGTIKKLLSDDGNKRIRDAVENAKTLEQYWAQKGKTIPDQIKEMNPSVSVHILIERLLDEIEYSCK